MYQHKNSTKEKPLLFFENFLQKENFEDFESSFYSNVINPSFKANLEKGYIEYVETDFVTGEVVLNRVYFIKRLTIIFNNQIIITLKLIKDWTEEYLNRNDNVENYINNQTAKITKLRDNLDFQNSITTLISKYLNKIEVYLKEFDTNSVKNTSIKVENPIIPSISLFGLNQNIKGSHINQLYHSSCELEIIDFEDVSLDVFVKIFGSSVLIQNHNQIQFKADNQIIAFYFKCLRPYFRKLSHTTIVKSEMFLNKGGNAFTTGALDTALTYSKKKPLTDLRQIQSEIEDIFKETL
jgi:hypothetical protein